MDLASDWHVLSTQCSPCTVWQAQGKKSFYYIYVNNQYLAKHVLVSFIMVSLEEKFTQIFFISAERLPQIFST